MGGLVIKWCATHHLVKRKIARIITIAAIREGQCGRANSTVR